MFKANSPEQARDAIATFIEQLASARRSAAIIAQRKLKAASLNAQADDLEFIARKTRAMEFEPLPTIHCTACNTQITCYEIGCIREANNT